MIAAGLSLVGLLSIWPSAQAPQSPAALQSVQPQAPAHVGNGVTSPQVLKQVRPMYTRDAMKKKIQGIVLLECVVMPDGTTRNVVVVKSLDKKYGLDEQAIKAAKQWRFAPGTRFGEPVPVIVTIELTFTLK